MIDDGADSPYSRVKNSKKQAWFNIMLLREADFDKDSADDSVALRTRAMISGENQRRR